MSTKYGIQYPPLPNASTQAFIDAQVPSPTGNMMDDFRTALVNACSLTDHNDLCLDDIWQCYVQNVIASDANAEAGNPAAAGRGKGGFVGNNPAHYYAQDKRNDAGGSVGFPGGNVFEGNQLGWDDRTANGRITLSGTNSETAQADTTTNWQMVECRPEVGMPQGQLYYWEVYVDNLYNDNMILGMTYGQYHKLDATLQIAGQIIADANYPGSTVGTFGVNGTGFRSDGVNDYGVGITGFHDAFTTGDVVMFAYDGNTNRLWMGVNGTWADGGDPTTQTNQGASWGGFKENIIPPVPAAGLGGTTGNQSQVTIRLKSEDQTYDPPTGYTARGDGAPLEINPMRYFLREDGNNGTTDKRLDVVTNDDARGMGFNSDGTQVWYFEDSGPYSYVYATLSTPYDLSTAGSWSNGVNLTGNPRVYNTLWNNDGTQILAMNASFATMWVWDADTAYDISSVGQTTTATVYTEIVNDGGSVDCRGWAWNADGTGAIFVNSIDGKIRQYSGFTTAYDIEGEISGSLATEDENYDFGATFGYNPRTVAWYDNGTKLVVGIDSETTFITFVCDTPYDITSRSAVMAGVAVVEGGASFSAEFVDDNGTERFFRGNTTKLLPYVKQDTEVEP